MQKRECDVRLSKKCYVVSIIGDVVSMKYNYIIILKKKKTKRDIALPVVIIQCDSI
jgi:hypothetical protein